MIETDLLQVIAKKLRTNPKIIATTFVDNFNRSQSASELILPEGQQFLQIFAKELVLSAPQFKELVCDPPVWSNTIGIFCELDTRGEAARLRLLLLAYLQARILHKKRYAVVFTFFRCAVE